jgi:hypothetical protein
MNEEDVLHYYHQFLVLSKPLSDSQRLTTSERNKVFWHGFHSRDHAEMYARLIAKHPDQLSGIYFDYLDIYKVARATFSGTRKTVASMPAGESPSQPLWSMDVVGFETEWRSQATLSVGRHQSATSAPVRGLSSVRQNRSIGEKVSVGTTTGSHRSADDAARVRATSRGSAAGSFGHGKEIAVPT